MRGCLTFSAMAQASMNVLEKYIVEKKSRPQKVRLGDEIPCLFCDEKVSFRNMARHCKSKHRYCAFCTTWHSIKELNQAQCPVYNKLMGMYILKLLNGMEWYSSKAYIQVKLRMECL